MLHTDRYKYWHGGGVAAGWTPLQGFRARRNQGSSGQLLHVRL